MQPLSTTPRAMIGSFWRNRGLVRVLVEREVVGRYRGSVLGILWSFFNPVFMLVVYTFVFSVVFKARWSVDSESRAEFALVLFAGMLVFNLFAECVNRAPSLILANANYVKKVIFPLEILPWVALGAALFHACVSLSVWLVFSLFIIGVPHATLLLFPLLLVPLILMIMGFSWFLAALGVYLRDVTQVVGVITTSLMFLTPIFYPVSAIPETFRFLMALNPMAFIVVQTHALLVFGTGLDWGGYALLTLFAFAVSWLGFAWFQKTRKGFADVL